MSFRYFKKILFGTRPAIPEALSGFMGRERIFRAPPFTEEYSAAILLIAPNCRGYSANEKYCDLWEEYQNAASWSEFQTLQPILNALPRPRRVLEIGPGLGRSLVFFAKQLGLQGADMHAYEGDGTTTKYTKLGPRFEDSFCGNIRLLRETLAYNGIGDVTVHDASKLRLGELPGPFDLLYSFYSIGYHWSVEHFLEEVRTLLSEDGTAVFTVPPAFEPAGLGDLLYLELPLFPDARKQSRRDRLLLLRKSPFPAAVRVGD